VASTPECLQGDLPESSHVLRAQRVGSGPCVAARLIGFGFVAVLESTGRGPNDE
jgi:hypothetical protein